MWLCKCYFGQEICRADNVTGFHSPAKQIEWSLSHVLESREKAETPFIDQDYLSLNFSIGLSFYVYSSSEST